MSAIILSAYLAACSTVKANLIDSGLVISDNLDGTIAVTARYDIFDHINGTVAPGTTKTFAKGVTIDAGGINNESGFPSGTTTVYLTEKDDPSLVSDILIYTTGQVYVFGDIRCKMDLTFQSFVTAVPLSSFTLQAGDQVLSEAGGDFDFGLHGYLHFPEGSETVPETGSMIVTAMMLIPVGASAVLRRRKSREGGPEY